MTPDITHALSADELFQLFGLSSPRMKCPARIELGRNIVHDFFPWEYNETTDELYFVCPICGDAGLSSPAYSSLGSGSLEICKCCGTQFDSAYDGTRLERLRSMWVRNGMKWRHAPGPPADWNPEAQSKKIGYIVAEAEKVRPVFGSGKTDILYMAEDFDAPLDDFKDYM